MDYALVIKDPRLFHLITDDAKKKLMLGGMNTVNKQAFLTRKNAIQNIKNQFITRNNFTTKNIIVEKCTMATKIEDIKSEVGATENIEYMERQEKGGEHKPTNGNKLAIPTTASRTGGNKAGVVAKRMRMGSLINRKLNSNKTKTSFQSRSARIVANAFIASKKRKIMHFGKDLYAVSNFVKSGGKISFDKTMLRNLRFTSTQTPKNPWLEPASQKPREDAQSIFNSEMRKAEK